MTFQEAVGFTPYHKPLELLNPWVRWVLNLILIFLVQTLLNLTILDGIKKCTFFEFGPTWLKSLHSQIIGIF